MRRSLSRILRSWAALAGAAALVLGALLWAGGDNGTDAAYPGDNGLIAFTSGSRDDVNEQVYTMSPDGSDVERLSPGNVGRAPSWSPDGMRVAYNGEPVGDSDNYDIFVVNADGTGLLALTDDPAGDHNPTWSPDGTKIAFDTVRDGPHEIYVMNDDGTGQTRLTNNAVADAAPAWSPDGSKIAYTSVPGGTFQIYVMNADGTGQTPLTSGANNGTDPDWSPDGSKIAFVSNRDGGNFDIYVMNADGTNQTRLTTDAVADQQPAWSPDGTKILYTSNVGPFSLGEIFVMDADGSNQVRLTNDEPYDSTPSWQPIPRAATPTPTEAPTPTSSAPGGQLVVFGNLDCNEGGISSRDNQALLRRVLSQAALSQTEPCPDIGNSVGITVPAGGQQLPWGDLDCNGEISSRDNQALLRKVLSQAALSQTEPCPDIGTAVVVSDN